MKHFDEIWNNFDCDIDCENETSCTTCEKVAKQFYKEALEWLYVEMTGTDLSTVRDMINKELEEK